MQTQVKVRPGAAERLAKMVQIPTVSAELETRGLAPFQEFIKLLETEYPLLHSTLSRETIGDLGVLYKWAGQHPETDPVVLMAHYDVVPVETGEDWQHPGFSGTIADGFVHGRGTLDDKGPLLVLCEAVENLLGSGFTPARDIYLAFGGDEESHGKAALAVAETLRERGVTPWLVLDEGGAITPEPLPFVSATAAMVGVAEKGQATVKITATSSGGHSSVPPKLTAITRLNRALAKLHPTIFRAKTPIAISHLLQTLAAHSTFPGRLLYSVLGRFPRLNAAVFARLGGEAAALVRTTVAVTQISGGSAHNVLPGHAAAVVNLRLSLGDTVPKTLRRIRRALRDSGLRVELLEGNDPSPESAATNTQFKLIRDSVAVSHPGVVTVPYVTMAATDSRHYHSYCPATYRFAPLLMDAALRDTIHGVDEKVAVTELARGEKFYRALIERIPA